MGADVSEATDLMLMVGLEYYKTLQQFVDEAEMWGVSKRIPSSAIPNGIVPGVSRMFLWYPEVIPVVTAEGKTFAELVTLLYGWRPPASDLLQPWNPALPLTPGDPIPESIMQVTFSLQGHSKRRELEREFGIQWQAAVFGWCYLDAVQYTVPEGEEVPEEVYAKYGDSLKYVTIEYADDEEGEEEQDEADNL